MKEVIYLSCINFFILCDTCLLNSSLAEVNTLSTDEGPLRWVPVIESVIPIIIHRKKVSLPECYLISFMTI